MRIRRTGRCVCHGRRKKHDGLRLIPCPALRCRLGTADPPNTSADRDTSADRVRPTWVRASVRHEKGFWMSIIYRSLGAGLLVAALALAIHLTGGSQSTHAESALVVSSSGFPCVVLDGNKKPVVTSGGIVNVSTDSRTGVATFVCSTDGVSNETGRAQRFDSGFLCWIPGVGWTEDWQAIVTPSGMSTLVCHVTP